jgi:hypothetical protein
MGEFPVIMQIYLGGVGVRLDRSDVVYLHFLWIAWLADIIRGGVPWQRHCLAIAT